MLQIDDIKVGDKVRCINPYDYRIYFEENMDEELEGQLELGKVYTIYDIDGGDPDRDEEDDRDADFESGVLLKEIPDDDVTCGGRWYHISRFTKKMSNEDKIKEREAKHGQNNQT
jgi:hypothetical protein